MVLYRHGSGSVVGKDPTRDESDATQNGMKLCEKHAVLASVAASKNSYAHVTADQEVSVKMLAEELKTLAEVWWTTKDSMFTTTTEREIVRSLEEKLCCIAWRWR